MDVDATSTELSQLSLHDAHDSSKPTDASELEQVSLERDALTDEEHAALDAEVLHFFSANWQYKRIPALANLLSVITLDDSRLTTLKTDAAKKLIEGEPAVATILRRAWQAGLFKDVRRPAILWPALKERVKGSVVTTKDDDEPLVEEQLRASEYSWTREYIGSASEELWKHLKRHYAIGWILMPNTLQLCSYQAWAASKGYPPPDHGVRDYLCRDESDSYIVLIRANTFLSALFDETAAVLQGETDSVPTPDGLPPIDLSGEGKPLAFQFRAYMNHGITTTSYGEFRTAFYAKVVEKAEKVAIPLCEAHRRQNNPPATGALSVSVSPSRLSAENSPHIESFRRLQQLFSPKPPDSPTLPSNFKRQTRSQGKGKAVTSDNEPWVVIAADEAHTMTTIHERVLAFLAFPLYNWEDHADLSARVVDGRLSLIAPFTYLGFDQLANKITRDGSAQLEDITTNDHISHYGRPMCGARFDYNNDNIKRNIIRFAAMKLLGGVPYSPTNTLNDNQKLACLAQRLPINFYSTTYLHHQRQEMQQVEGHLCVCLKIDNGFQSMQTVSPSEPLLSEAAYWIMQHPDFDAADSLKQVLNGFAVHKGDRGELIIMLLLTLARDSAVGPANQLGIPEGERRWTPVTSFFKSLFHEPPNRGKKGNIFRANGSLVTSEGVSTYDKEFGLVFKDSKFNFSHWIKVHQFALLNVKYLLALYCRGAAILCANNQPAINGLMPYLLSGTELRPDNLGVCIWQGKNDTDYTDTVVEALFQMMDPFTLKIFNDNPGLQIPIIRIVFALAAKTPSVRIVKAPTTTSGKPYISTTSGVPVYHPKFYVPLLQERRISGRLFFRSPTDGTRFMKGITLQKGLSGQ